MGVTVSIYLEEKQVAWLDKQSSRSDAVQKLIKEKIKNEDDPKFLIDSIRTTESSIRRDEKLLDFYYNKLETLNKRKFEMDRVEQERMKKLLVKREDEMEERTKKVEACSIYKEMMKSGKTDYAYLSSLVDKLRKEGNREVGVYSLIKYLEHKGLREPEGNDIVREVTANAPEQPRSVRA